MQKIKKIMFLCFGNTCRSPAAEYLAKGIAETKYEGGLEDVEFESSGFINAFSHAQPETVEYLKSKGLDMSQFRPQILNAELLKESDLILTMEEDHKKKVLKNYKKLPNIEEKVFTLKEFAGEVDYLDIPDPFMTNHEAYLKTMIDIEEYVELTLAKIIEINKND